MQSLKSFKSLKASSLVESVIAIAIISVCVLVAFMIYINVVSQNHSVNYYQAKHKVDYLVQQSIDDNEHDDELYTFDGYTINKVVEIRKEERTTLLTFTIKTGGKTYIINKLLPYQNE